MEELGITVTAECPSAANGKHTWTNRFIETGLTVYFDAKGSIKVRSELFRWRCKHCGLGAADPEDIEYRQLIDSVISEALEGEDHA